MTEDLNDLFAEDRGAQRLWAILRDPNVSQITTNAHNRIFYIDQSGVKAVDQVFTPATYETWVNQLMTLTDVGYTDVASARTAVIEGSFDPAKTDIHGSIHICTKELSRGEPIVTIRKQPHDIITLDQMLTQGMMSPDMRLFLEQAIRGRLNVLIAGGSGAGKTTLARALSWFIDPAQRVVTAEEIDELHLHDRLPNVAALTTHKSVDENGQVLRRVTLEELVREALRMRPDRIWVGETRGSEAYALCKACNSGHDGSVTTLHADTSQQAWKQLVSYTMEGGVGEEVARDQIAQAFHLAVQVSKVRMGRRVVTEITELEAVREGNEQRRNPLYVYDYQTDTFQQQGRPTSRIVHALQRYGVNWDEIPGR